MPRNRNLTRKVNELERAASSVARSSSGRKKGVGAAEDDEAQQHRAQDVARPQVVKGWSIRLENQLDEAVKRIEALEEKEAHRAAAEAEAAAAVGEQSTIGSLHSSTTTYEQNRSEVV